MVCYRFEGTVPIPAVGEVVGLDYGRVVVTAVHTQYGRDETTGRPIVFTSVSVKIPPPDAV